MKMIFAIVLTALLLIPPAHAKLLWVSERGDDATAERGKRSKPWKTIYDIYDSSNHVSHGAATAARPGDWIVLEPGTYFVPAIPLNLPGNGNLGGINLLVPHRATIVRSNFSNTNSLQLNASLASCGPLIVPGDRSTIVIEGTVIATNNVAFDAVFGWADFLTANAPAYGFTNRAAFGVMLRGHGTLIGNSDVIYVAARGGSVACRNVHLRSQWDCCFFSGSNVVRTTHLNAVAGATMPGGNGASHGIVVANGGNWVDRRSSFTASGTALPGNDNAAAYVLLGSTNRFEGTRLIATGGTNVAPFIAVDATSYGWYFSYSEGENYLQSILVRLGSSFEPRP